MLDTVANFRAQTKMHWDAQIGNAPDVLPQIMGKYNSVKQAVQTREYSYKPTNGSCGTCYNAYYSEGCCRPREIKDTCDYNYKYKNNGFPTSLWPEQQCIASETDIKNTISVTCANEYYIIPGYTTVGFKVETGQKYDWSDDKIEITDCSGCSTEKCKPQTPTSCYNSDINCLSEEKNGKNLKYEWIQCKRNDPNSCGFSSTDDLYKNKIKTHADNTYVRQKFYDYDTTKQSCSITWGEIDCATDGYELNTENICVACPAGTYAEYATTDGVRKRKCKNCPKGNSTFTDDNKDGIIDKFTTGNTSQSNCKPCPAGYIQISTTRKCSKCAEGTYNSLKGQSNTTNTCPYTCPTNFTTDTEDLNDSIQKCYINPTVKLSDSLGTITLSEEIGSRTKLYYQ